MTPDAPSRYVPGVVVRYLGATDTKGSRWSASLDRGGEHKWRAGVPYQDGPDAAVAAVLLKANAALGVSWSIQGPALTLNGGGIFAYPVA